MNKFEAAHQAFIQHHLLKRSGERRDRLERGYQHAEKLFLRNIWWPYRGNFDDLHPEYEILDWRGFPYYADFAFLQSYIKIIVEIKGFKSHVQDMDRTRFSNEQLRESFLKAMGFHVVSFSYDDVERRPELCIRMVQLLMNQLLPKQSPKALPELAEKEVLRLVVQYCGRLRPVQITDYFGINHRTAVRIITGLCTKGWLRPIYGPNGQRAVQYELNDDGASLLDILLS